ncbi:hypothetical protein ACI2K4_06715 [Micromonospora sp. NPDC050397]|uniref:hypothetical protein n=1 Tax=Micromonospora sp. NPDC050397 TaxID=3364279 RepID=UPI00384EEE39
MSTTPLLPVDSLAGVRLGISVSESTDLARLGLLETHLRLALGELTRTVLLTGGSLLYGGRLAPDGYATFVATELHRHTRRDRPLELCLAWHEHRRMTLSDLERFRQELGLVGRLVCLDPNGVPIAPADGRGEPPEPVTEPRDRHRALTGLRHFMRDRQHGRVFVGGRRYGFEGSTPGLMEESLVALRAGQPIYLAGGFGGVTSDIARLLGVDDGDWLPPDPREPSPEPGFLAGCDLLRELTSAPGWSGLANGLSDEENGWLAVTHRPSDIATLVGLGLGRLNSAAG